MAMAFDPGHGTSGPGGAGQLLLFGGNFMTGTGNGTVNPNANTWVWDVAQPGTVNVVTYTTHSGTIQDLPAASFTVSGPCTSADAVPCKKNPVKATQAYSASADPGFYSVTFTAVSGYTTPATQNIMLNPGETITFSANWR
jgi:hypothetical protein